MTQIHSSQHHNNSNNNNIRQTVFAVLSAVLALGYLIQFHIIKDLVDGQQQQQQQQQQNSNNQYLNGRGGGNNSNNNNNNNFLIITAPFRSGATTRDEDPKDDAIERQRHAQTRTRITESQILPLLEQAYHPVEDMVQPPLGYGTTNNNNNDNNNNDESLLSYKTDVRGIDMSLPQNEKRRSNRILYLITPTYKRRTQMVDMTRLSQTLRLAREAGYHERLYWIILEDATHPTHRVRQFALESGIPFAHKAVKTPPEIMKNPKAHRGIEQRNAGLDIVEQVGAEGVVYFMDDDNAYHVQLFHELSYTTHVSVFGVGMPGGSAYERCHVDPQTGKVDKLLTTWQAPRTFAIDMAGFAFATHHLARARAMGNPMRFTHISKPGFLENDLISFAANTVEELEPLAANCTRILSWHVKTVGNDLYYNPEGSKEKFNLMTRLV